MPYTNCPSCELSVYAPRVAFSTKHFCPRCETVLAVPSRLFTTALPPRLAERVKSSRRVAAAQPARAHRHGPYGPENPSA